MGLAMVRGMKLPLSYGFAILLFSLAFAVPASAVDSGRRAPEFSLTDLSGNPVQLSQLRGKVVVVDFWASWCEPCRQALPELEQIYQRHQEAGLVVVGVNVDRDAANARSFLRRTRVSFPVVHDEGQRVAGQYRPPRMPSTFVIDRQGVVRHVHAGYRNGDGARIETAIRSLL